MAKRPDGARLSRSSPVHTRALVYGAWVTAGIAIAGSAIGFLTGGLPAVYSALIGAGLAAIFMGTTALSVLVASRLKSRSEPDLRFFAIVLGAWLLKILVFLGVLIWLRYQSWLNPWMFFLCALVAVIGFLVVDIVALQTSRIPVVAVRLPGEGETEVQKSDRKS